MDAYAYSEPSIYTNACILRHTECKLQRPITILCMGDEMCGERWCDLPLEYFENMGNEISVSSGGKGKSTGVSSIIQDPNLPSTSSHICSANNWICDTSREGNLIIEHGICLQDFNNKQSCECSIDRKGSNCEHQASVGINGDNRFNGNGNGNLTKGQGLLNGRYNYCGNSCNTCWMFGLMSMIVLVIVVALLVRRVPAVTYHSSSGGGVGSSMDASNENSSLLGLPKNAIRRNSRCNSNVSQLAQKYSSVNALNLLNEKDNSSNNQNTNRNELSVKHCLSTSSSRHEINSPLDSDNNAPPRPSSFYQKRDSLSVPHPYGINGLLAASSASGNGHGGDRSQSTSEGIGIVKRIPTLTKVSSAASLRMQNAPEFRNIKPSQNDIHKTPSFTLGHSNKEELDRLANTPRQIIKIPSSSNFDKFDRMVPNNNEDKINKSRLMNRRERAFSLKINNRPQWDGDKLNFGGSKMSPYSSQNKARMMKKESSLPAGKG